MWTTSQLISSLCMTLVTLGLLYFYAKKFSKRYDVKGKVVLVTGACAEGGLGINIAGLFKTFGAKIVIVTSRSEQSGLSTLEFLECVDGPGQIVHAVLDLDWPHEKIQEMVQDLWTRFGKINIVVANAGVSYRGDFAKTTDKVHRNVMQSNYFGNVSLLTSAVQLIEEHTQKEKPTPDSGFYLVGVTSIQGRISIPHRSAYSASKHAFSALLDCLRAELATKENTIRVLNVAPSYIRTNLSRNAVRDSGEKHQRMDTTTSAGMLPEEAASHIVSAIRRGESELLLLDTKSWVALYLRLLLPSIFFKVMAKRAQSSKAY